MTTATADPYGDLYECPKCGTLTSMGDHPDGLCTGCENARDDMADRRFEASREN